MNFVKSLNMLGTEAYVIPCIPGEGVPTTATEGAVGSLYMNTLTGEIYRCTSVNNGVYTWKTCMGEDGKDGVSVTSVKQTTTSSADGGSNVITVTLSDGTTSTFTVKNGSKGGTGATGATGANGADGYTPVRGTDYWTEADKAEIKAYVDEAILGGAW